ncbi:SH3 domain-containing protein [Parasphingorhabdus sp.]|uniref:SH3 domain-containing protein n=1 Tax=Parasphingorhabdus sp. TaxID=2709688 RepID=UPI002F93C6A9
MRKFSLRILSILGAAIWILAAASPAMAQKEPPYWASIDEAKARMRTGPSTGYPTVWIYQRKHLPIKVVARYKSWRKIEDPDGTQGWMHARLLTATQTAIVLGKKGQIRTLRSKPDGNAKIIWRVEGGVVGKITDCEGQWCLFDANGRRGYIARDMIWGDEPLK